VIGVLPELVLSVVLGFGSCRLRTSGQVDQNREYHFA
jgi:hypothetical protein